MSELGRYLFTAPIEEVSGFIQASLYSFVYDELYRWEKEWEDKVLYGDPAGIEPSGIMYIGELI